MGKVVKLTNGKVEYQSGNCCPEEKLDETKKS